ncbi:hypothetical protein DICPUDRAFT_96979 [Dictyostelium purpureum]|uniref:MIF4G domain-containing protein n=1 Tax=Dictyostelium purpureum TaxID=5786 RepID=F0ZCX1_DICPU|nr:uncharacterized protein DICPUDRAFT_96979 [Dictyostelium purpureum]EGC38212.1 hypothetical protein DICPUDRAFT_96979 [Dictyostelium purpureum]|eukprot:XP_003285250.1 hypothetical protein DICPUDRAFT_96979 [Dictyostelium purpureum]
MNQSDSLNIVIRILNKISKDNFQVLIDQLVSKYQLLDKDDSIVFLDKIFEKVVEEPSTSLPYYIQIINKISPIFEKKYSSGFGNIIVDHFNNKFNNYLKQLRSSSSFSDYDLQCKQNIINLSKFMGECYYSLPNTFLIDFVNEYLPKDLSKDPSEDLKPIQLTEVETLATIFTAAGKTIDSFNKSNCASLSTPISSPSPSDQHFQNIQTALDNATPILLFLIDNRQLLPPRVRFMVKNLFELKNNKWIIPKPTNDDFNTQKEILKLATTLGKNVTKTIMEKCEDDSTLLSIFWKGFFQTIGINNYKMLRQMMIDEKSTLSPSSSSPTIPLSPFLRRTISNSPSQFNLSGGSTPSQMDIDPTSFDLNQMDPTCAHNSLFEKENQVPSIHNLLNQSPQQQNNQSNENNDLPNGFLSPKISRSTSPSLSSTSTTTIIPTIAQMSKGREAYSNPNSLNNLKNHNINSNNNNSNNNNNYNNNNNSVNSNNNANKTKESPELSNTPDSNLSVIVSIIDSKIWTPQKEIWKKKIMNKIIPMKSTLKKTQKIEILAAIWQNMCDNNYEYGSYFDLCLNLIKMDEGELSPLYAQPEEPQQPPVKSGKPPATAEPIVNPLLNKIKTPNRRSSMVALQMKPNAPISEARRSSISVPFELNRRGSLSGDIPTYCPPAPKLKSTPTLKSTPATSIPLASLGGTQSLASSQKNTHPSSEVKKQPNAKKHKPDLDTFKDVLVSSLQDDFALKMFVKKRSLTTYMELLKDLYREFIIEIPLLLKCISLVHNGLYELTDEECTLLFDLEEMAQEQQNLEKQNNQQQNLLTNNNQIFHWKTQTWEDKPQTPPPPPNSYVDLNSDVFVL